MDVVSPVNRELCHKPHWNSVVPDGLGGIMVEMVQ